MTATSVSKVLRGFAASLLVLAAAAVTAQAADNGQVTQEPVAAPPRRPAKAAEITLVGRGNQAAEISKDGKVTEFGADSLEFKNRSKGSMAAPRLLLPAPEEKTAGAATDTATTTEEEAIAAAEAAAQKAVDQAMLDADRKAIEEMRESRYMWFFDENGKVMTTKELDRRIAEGNFTGMKAMNDDRAEWRPRSSAAGKDKEEAGPPPPPKRDSQPSPAPARDAEDIENTGAVQ